MTGQSLVNVPASQNQPPAPAAEPAKTVMRGGRQVRHLAQSVVLEETGTSALVRLALFVTCAAITLFIVWAALTPVEEVAVTDGTVVPSASVQDLQHLEGGIVTEILVSEGELVQAGQTLLRLSPAQAQSELEQMRARQAGLLLKAERLRAFVEGREPDFSLVGPGFDALIADQILILQTQIQARSSAEAVVESQVDQRGSEVRLYRDQLVNIEEQIEFLAEEVRMREELLPKGLVSKVVYLDSKRELARVKGERARILGQLSTAELAKAEARSRFLDLQNVLHQQTMDEVGTVTSELAQVQENLLRLYDRVNRLDVVAGTRGLIQSMTVKSVGAVVQPGQVIGQVIPLGEDLMVENKISTRDIGHVAVGQSVAVKVATFDFARFGAIPAELVGISPNTFLDEEGTPYYKGEIKLLQNYVGSSPARNHVLPGMTVQADISTGEKTLLEYLLKPIYVALTSSFRER